MEGNDVALRDTTTRPCRSFAPWVLGENQKVPFNYQMGRKCKIKFYVIVVGLQIGVYEMCEEVDRLVKFQLENCHKAFRVKVDAHVWLHRQFFLHGGQINPRYRRNVAY